jgi:hypothetical protein
MGVTASSTAFGVSSYTGLQVAHGVIEVLSAAANFSPPIQRRANRGLIMRGKRSS